MDATDPTTWPDDADGDVFRRLLADDFDFFVPHTVDYNVDFDDWPPSDEALSRLAQLVGEFEVIEPDEEGDGYVCFQVTGLVTYEGVMRVQRETSEALEPFGGVCESWGVLH